MFLSTTWALVGDGSNLKPRTSYNMNSPKVIVSKSHAGKVKGFIEEAFGTTSHPPSRGRRYCTFVYIFAGNGLLTALGGHMTTLKGEEIDHSGVAGNNGGLLVSVKVDHHALVAKLQDDHKP
uniref:Uncharacterized protein n=1 Tax=Oncorhynchus tshawytscha TaxID=74940 RepID=A0A8C8C676_ONCTS